jgi:hypothetical protein
MLNTLTRFVTNLEKNVFLGLFSIKNCRFKMSTDVREIYFKLYFPILNLVREVVIVSLVGNSSVALESLNRGD